MTLKQWTPVPWSSIADEQFADFIDAMKTAATTPDGIFRSESGRIALIVNLGALRAVENVEIRLEQTSPATTRVAWLLVDTDSLSRTEELRALSGIGGLLALPAELSKELPGEFLTRGQIVQQLDGALTDTFDVFECRAKSFELLSRDAPTDLGEGPDNLAGRASWFKKRH